MHAKIVSMENCPNCRMLKTMCPDTETVQPSQDALLNVARTLGISSMPFVILVGEPQELAKVIKGE